MACNSNPDGFSIAGTVTGDMEDGTQVFLKKSIENKPPVDVDTTTVTGGIFSFEGAAGTPEIYYIAFDKTQGFIPLIMEKGDISLKVQKDSLAFAKVKGTIQNEIFSEYLEKSRAISSKGQSMSVDMRAAGASQDTATMNALRDEFAELQEEAKTFEIDFIKENPNALIAALLIDKALKAKILHIDEVKEMYEALTPEIKNTTTGKSIEAAFEKEANKVPTTIGSKAPNFSAPTPTGETLALNDVLGKVTIIDFWAGWCRPCRAENPNVVNVYNEYHDKGLNIIGVSLDKNAEQWKQAILDDGLTWNHISNVDYFDEIAQLYNVNAIPATFILDENGIIIARNLRGVALGEKMAELLN